MELNLSVNDILFLVRENKKFLDYFSQIEELELDLFSFMANKECNCKETIINYIESHVSEINDIINSWKRIEHKWETILQERQKEESVEKENVKDNLKKTFRKVTDEEKYIMGPNKDGIARNLTGHMIEMGAIAKNYKEMVKFGENNKWRYNGICVVKTVTKINKKPFLVYKNFFY